MNRREFIKKTLGDDAFLFLKWAFISIVLILMFSIDFSEITINMPGFIKLAGILFLCVVALFILGLIFKFIGTIILKVIPKPALNWIKRNRKIAEYVILIPLLGYIIYRCVEAKNYFLLVFMAGYSLLSFFLRTKEGKERQIKE
jgi:hypothetical protein